MVLESFSRALRRLWNKLRGMPIDERQLDEVISEFEDILISADVNVELVMQLGEKIRERVLREAKNLPKGVPLNSVVLKALWDELVRLAGEKQYPLNIRLGRLNKLLFVGLQGSGKTTTVAKVAYWLKKRGYKVALICADTYRPGAYEQLKQLAEKIDVPVYGDPNCKDAVEIVKRGLEKFKKYDVVLIDTAGRHRREEDLMREMRELVKAIKPDEVILVVDGMMGQRAYEQAKAFAEAVGKIGSIIVTKLDSSARGGGAIAACAATGAPIKFIGTGEKIEDLEPYSPVAFISRLLGIPDQKLLAEISQFVPREVAEGKFTLLDLKNYYESVLKKHGFFSRLKQLLGLGLSEKMMMESVKRQLAILCSMTRKELENPELLKEPSRIERIARGAGVTPAEVRKLLRQYRLLKKAVRTLMRQRSLSKMAALEQIMTGQVDLSELADLKELRRYLRWLR